MASSLSSLLLFLTLGPLLAEAAGGPAAPAPTPQPLNLTGILDKGGQFLTFIRLLRETQVGQQIDSQLNNSNGNGFTVFAPTDNAFNNLKAGALNGLSRQDQVALVLFHVLPKFYSFDLFQTVSNPVPTQASGRDGVYTLNITSANNQANVSTGVDATRINSALYSTFPLVVYPVEAVLKPEAIFGEKPPASAPRASEATPRAPSTPAAAAGGPASSESQNSPSAASFEGRQVGWWGVLAGAGLVSMGLMW